MKLKSLEMLQIEREYCERSLSNFIRRAWHVIEPGNQYIHGWHIDAICEHLEAVTNDEILRLFIAVPPGTSKSTTVGVFHPAWEWGPKKLSHYRYIGTSHAAPLAIRDNVKARRLITSEWYQSLWGDTFSLLGDQNEKIKYENDRTGFRQACAFTGLTGARGDRVLMDDVMSVDDAGSDVKRGAINQTFLEAVPSRLTNPKRSAIINIQQRLHPLDTIGVSMAKELGYDGLVLPMEFEKGNRCITSIGFKDPRKEEGELLFEARFPRKVVDDLKKSLGSFAAASQLQQRPVPREGGMFKRHWFEVVDVAPAGIDWIRGWDLAATEASQGKDPAYTAGAKMGVSLDGTYYIGDVVRGQLSPGGVENLLVNTASQDGRGTIVDIPQDPGQAGKAQVRYLVKKLAGYNVKFGPETGSKELRASPLASQAEAGNVKIVRGAWNEAFLEEAELFPNAKKDQIDAASRAFSGLTKPVVNDDFAAPMIL